MIYFLVSILAFFLFLALFCLSVASILKKRGNAEEFEYLLRKAYTRRYGFILGVSVYIESKELLLLREDAIKAKDLKKIREINDRISLTLDSLKLSKEDRKECISLKKDIDCYIDAYNDSVDIFNRSVFGIRNRFAARICQVKRLERI